MSVGPIDALLSGHTDTFIAEKNQVLTTGLAVSRWNTVDDSGARPTRRQSTSARPDPPTCYGGRNRAMSY